MTCFSEEKVCENKTIHLISRSFPLPNFLLENMHMGLDVSWREGSGASHSLWLWVSPALEAVSFSPRMVSSQSWQEGSRLRQVSDEDPLGTTRLVLWAWSPEMGWKISTLCFCKRWWSCAVEGRSAWSPVPPSHGCCLEPHRPVLCTKAARLASQHKFASL